MDQWIDLQTSAIAAAMHLNDNLFIQAFFPSSGIIYQTLQDNCDDGLIVASKIIPEETPENLEQLDLIAKLRPNRGSSLDREALCDEDDSGDYDPSSETAKPTKRKGKTKFSLEKDVGESAAKGQELLAAGQACSHCVNDHQQLEESKTASKTQSETSIASRKRSSRPNKVQIDGRTSCSDSRLNLPIEFNALDNDCSFCNSIQYSLMGQRRSGKFKEQGQSTRLCEDCTTNRILIMTCLNHVLENTLIGNKPTMEQMLQRLMEDRCLKSDPWCTLCPNMANYSCIANKVSTLHTKGCGMRLCDQCATGLTERFAGSLQDFIKKTERGVSDSRRLGLRADIELLSVDGELLKYMRETFGQ